jgi:hypothetical protein
VRRQLSACQCWRKQIDVLFAALGESIGIPRAVDYPKLQKTHVAENELPEAYARLTDTNSATVTWNNGGEDVLIVAVGDQHCVIALKMRPGTAKAHTACAQNSLRSRLKEDAWPGRLLRRS